MKHKDTVFVAACDVYKERLDEDRRRAWPARRATSSTSYEDYRRILDRKDVDAVLIATPDHWHSPMTIDACAAGKDVYVEKPVSNEIEPALQMLEAARKSQPHRPGRAPAAQLASLPGGARKLFHDGYIGTSVNHCQMCPPAAGSAAAPRSAATDAAGAARRASTGSCSRVRRSASRSCPRRRNWRGWYDYGGGNLTDWGVHLTDVMNWFMRLDDTVPLLTSASAQYVRLPRDPERVPDSYAVTWQYKNFVATLSNTMVPGVDNQQELYGNYFFGDRGVMHRQPHRLRGQAAASDRAADAGTRTPRASAAHRGEEVSQTPPACPRSPNRSSARRRTATSATSSMP